VDEERHILKNLCMLSRDSRNGRTYTPQALEDARRLYEGAKCYQDHPDDPTAQRSTSERLGRWRNIRLVGGKVRGDLHYVPSHPYAETLVWAAQHCPENCGISHNIEAEGYEDEDGHFTVSRITEVRSVDVVDDAATNVSLLESIGRTPPELIEDSFPMIPTHKIRNLLKSPDVRGERDLRRALEDLCDQHEDRDREDEEEGVGSAIGGELAGPVGAAVGSAFDRDDVSEGYRSITNAEFRQLLSEAYARPCAVPRLSNDEFADLVDGVSD
jgi:hypothetical protein